MLVNELIIRLSLASGVGARTITYICTYENWHEMIRAPTATLCRVFGLRRAMADLVAQAVRDDELFEKNRVWCNDNDTTVVTCDDARYPELLRHIAVPPPVLWLQGALLGPEYRACAMVGARAMSAYAARAIRSLVPDLVRSGLITVSGGARGVDGVVHQETVAAGGQTVVVMGCGLQHVYPFEHQDLFNKVRAQGGTLLSPFPPWVQPTKGTFPVRNRVIAGLAQVSVVVQAAKRSGALITTEHALQENRTVGAVPGPIDDERFIGSNRLLAQGAVVVCDAKSIITQFGGVLLPQSVVLNEEGEILSSELRTLLELLEQPQTFDDLVAAGHTDQSLLRSQLYELEQQRKVRQNFAGFWERHE